VGEPDQAEGEDQGLALPPPEPDQAGRGGLPRTVPSGRASPDRWPSWKIQVTTPYMADSRSVRAGPVGHVDPGDIAADAGDLRGADAGHVVETADVRGQAGGAGRRAGDGAGKLDDGLDRGGRVAGEVAVQRVGDQAGRGAGGQRGSVDATPDDLQERRAEAEQDDPDRDRVQDGTAHHTVREPVPDAARLGSGRALHRAADPERVHLGSQHG
jgi:hypothetical protein